MYTNFYTLTGNQGTVITVTVQHYDNMAMHTSYYIHALAPNAPEFYGDAISLNGAEFITGKLYECDMQTGDVWSVSFEDGDLTHADLAVDPEFTETFTIYLSHSKEADAVTEAITNGTPVVIADVCDLLRTEATTMNGKPFTMDHADTVAHNMVDRAPVVALCAELDMWDAVSSHLSLEA